MTLYEVLGVTAKATQTEIKTAYRRAAKTHHPDVGGDAGKFEQVQRAYAILSDPQRRSRYDDKGIEDDLAAATVEQLAHSAIATQITQFLSGNYDLNKTDIVAGIRSAFLKQKAVHDEICLQINTRIQRVDIVRSRLFRKDDKEDALAALLDDRERELFLVRSKECLQIDIIERALSLLEDYTYRLDPSAEEEAKIWFAIKP